MDATSPAPTLVRNFNVVSHQVHGITSLELALEWDPPATANGILSGYMSCVSPQPLALHEDPQVGGQSRCIGIQVTVSPPYLWPCIKHLRISGSGLGGPDDVVASYFFCGGVRTLWTVVGLEMEG